MEAGALPPQTESSPAFATLLSPQPGEVVETPVTIRFRTSPDVVSVALFADEVPLQSAAIPASRRHHVADLHGVNLTRRLRLEGYSAGGELLAQDLVDFVPSRGYLEPPHGFNAHVVGAINSLLLYPRDGSTPYCWRDCPGSMGMIHDVTYQGQHAWDGEGSCFCSGHTLEILLDGIRRWRAFHGVEESEPFGDLTYRALHGGDFYQYWQGYGVSQAASSADALEHARIGYRLHESAWDLAQPGDFVNISRTNGTGHSAIFVAWKRRRTRIVGLRYYGCNRAGHSHPDELSPGNRQGISGPSFITEYFVGHGGYVLPEWVFVGHVVDPFLGY